MELEERIENRQDYLPETVEATVAELKYRGREFSDEELRIINEDLQAQRQNAALVGGRVSMFNKEYKNVVVKDTEAPFLYSRLALYFFTVFMGALFGSVMMAINISKTENRSKALWAILFGVGFTVLQVLITNNLKNPNTSIAIIFGIVASYCLDYLFWKPFIGYSAFYRSRPIWIPLVIALVLAGLIIAAIMLA